jgi:hypothetical protein
VALEVELSEINMQVRGEKTERGLGLDLTQFDVERRIPS